MRIPILSALLLVVVAAPVAAHGPTPHKAEETVQIKRAPADVWKRIGDFDSLSTWNPAVKESTVSKGNEPGSERKVVLANGGELVDNLDSWDATAMTYTYRLYQENVEAFAVSYYTAELTVAPSEAGSEVKWTARYYRGDTHNDPPENLNDEAAAKAIHDYYRAGLDALKRELEK